MSSGTSSNSVTLAVTCVGRRIELLQAFRAAAQRLGLKPRLVGLDSDRTAPGLTCVDSPVLVPRASDPGYLAAVQDAVRAHGAQLLLPTTDTDLLTISEQRDEFTRLGCLPLIAEPAVIRTCRDKILTYEHLRKHGFDTPQTVTPDRYQPGALPFPLIIKPRCGSASQRVHRLEDQIDLEYHLRQVRDPIIQEFVAGTEYTLDVYVGLNGEPRCVVPRARWQVRTGEVSKGVVVKNPEIMDAGRRVVATLGTSLRGLVTLQCIVTAQRQIRFIEINPRFGGGAPLSIAAGADFPTWLLQEWRGAVPPIVFDGFTHGLCMLRYDWSVFLPLGVDLQPKLVQPLRDFPNFG